MSGWVTMLLLAAAVAAGLYPFARQDKGALQFVAAALLLALAGYSFQGRPGQPGAPKAAVDAAAADSLETPDDDFAILRLGLLPRFDRSAYWLTLSDGDRRRGNLRGAAQVLQAAVRRNPENYALWIAFGYALVAADGDVMTPAAQLAFNRAERLARGNPGPAFFYALALARGGNYPEAERIWRELLAELPPGSEYRAPLEERLAAIEQARRTGEPVRSPPIPAERLGPAVTSAPLPAANAR